MICPYNRKREKQVLQVSNDYSDEGQQTYGQQITNVDFEPMECPQEGCAVWRNGRCCYAAVSLDNE